MSSCTHAKTSRQRCASSTPRACRSSTIRSQGHLRRLARLPGRARSARLLRQRSASQRRSTSARWPQRARCTLPPDVFSYHRTRASCSAQRPRCRDAANRTAEVHISQRFPLTQPALRIALSRRENLRSALAPAVSQSMRTRPYRLAVIAFEEMDLLESPGHRGVFRPPVASGTGGRSKQSCYPPKLAPARRARSCRSAPCLARIM